MKTTPGGIIWCTSCGATRGSYREESEIEKDGKIFIRISVCCSMCNYFISMSEELKKVSAET
jgi:hypothetical protein